jgi:hypothetical protein
MTTNGNEGKFTQNYPTERKDYHQAQEREPVEGGVDEVEEALSHSDPNVPKDPIDISKIRSDVETDTDADTDTGGGKAA